MSNCFIRVFSVGNGNCVLLGIGQQRFLFDMHDCVEEEAKDCRTAWELVAPWLPTDQSGCKTLDTFCCSHGHTDHCGGFLKFKEEIDAGKLRIGEIWHNGHDRLWKETEGDLKKHEDCLHYLALRAEIERRRKCPPSFGNVQVELFAHDTESKCFTVVSKPDDFSFDVLSPAKAVIEQKEKLSNDHSLVIRVVISGLSVLFAGDAESGAWSRILSDAVLKARASSTILIVSHHGSFSFFGPDRNAVREATPFPINYPALDAIQSRNLIISAAEQFPTVSDPTRQPPPHYAAYKWYKKWYEENCAVSKSIQHPTSWKYTANGDVYIEYTGQWSFVADPPIASSKGYLPTSAQPARAGQTYA